MQIFTVKKRLYWGYCFILLRNILDSELHSDIRLHTYFKPLGQDIEHDSHVDNKDTSHSVSNNFITTNKQRKQPRKHPIVVKKLPDCNIFLTL